MLQVAESLDYIVGLDMSNHHPCAGLMGTVQSPRGIRSDAEVGELP